MSTTKLDALFAEAEKKDRLDSLFAEAEKPLPVSSLNPSVFPRASKSHQSGAPPMQTMFAEGLDVASLVPRGIAAAPAANLENQSPIMAGNPAERRLDQPDLQSYSGENGPIKRESGAESLARTGPREDADFLESISDQLLRDPVTYVGALGSSVVRKLAGKLAGMAFESPLARKALTALLEATQQGGITGGGQEAERYAATGEVDPLAGLKTAALGAGAEVGLRSSIAPLRLAGDEIAAAVKGLPEQAVIPPITPDAATGFRNTPAALGDQGGVRTAFERTIQNNPHTAPIYEQTITGPNREAIAKTISENPTARQAGVTRDPILTEQVGTKTDYERGKGIRDAVESGEENIGKTFGEQQRIAIGMKRPELGGETLLDQKLRTRTAQEPGMGRFKSKNVAVDDIENHLKSKGFDLDKFQRARNEGATFEKAFKETYSPAQNEISEVSAKWLLQRSDDIAKAKTFKELLNVRKNFQEKLFAERRKTDKIFSDADFSTMERFHQKINGQVGNGILEKIGGDEGIMLKGLWDDARETYATSRDLLEKISDKQGLEKAAKSAESYVRNIDQLGIDNVKRLKAAIDKNPDMLPVWNEVRGGIYDNFIKGSFYNGAIEVSPDKFVTNWAGMDKEMKGLLFEPSTIDTFNKLSDQIKKQIKVDASYGRGSRTAPLLQSQEFTRLESLVRGVIYKKLAPVYLKTGNIPIDGVIGILKSDKLAKLSKALRTATNPKTIQQLTQRINQLVQSESFSSEKQSEKPQ